MWFFLVPAVCWAAVIAFLFVRKRYPIVLLDVAEYWWSAFTAFAMWLSALTTVEWDVFGTSMTAIKFPVPVVSVVTGAPYTAYSVGSARSEYERRAVAWFYRWHDVPTVQDWRRCLARFRLKAVPHHILRVRGGAAWPPRTVSVAIALGDRDLGGTTRATRILVTEARMVEPLAPGGAPVLAPWHVEGPVPVGGLHPASYIADLQM